jgi:hypothetical protein
MTYAGRRYSFLKIRGAPWDSQIKVWSRIGSRLGLGDFVGQRLEDVLKERAFRTCSDIVATPL